MFDTVVNGVT